MSKHITTVMEYQKWWCLLFLLLKPRLVNNEGEQTYLEVKLQTISTTTASQFAVLFFIWAKFGRLFVNYCIEIVISGIPQQMQYNEGITVTLFYSNF